MIYVVKRLGCSTVSWMAWMARTGRKPGVGVSQLVRAQMIYSLGVALGRQLNMGTSATTAKLLESIGNLVERLPN